MAKRKSTEDVPVAGEIIDVKKAAKKEKKEAKKFALTSILTYVRDSSDDDLLLGYVKLLTPGNRAGRSSYVGSARGAVIELLVDNTVVTEDEIWNEFKLGRAEMRKISVNLIKKVTDPSKRIWVSFDPEDGEYTLIGHGSDVPEGWTGYRPVDTEDIDL